LSIPSSNDDAPLQIRDWLTPRLLNWYVRHRRDLPWRANRDPYRIWVSEVMLQQTQVATVIDYFQRFLARFPTLTDLARADEQEVLHLWQGLGYYRRARDLLRTARLLVERHQGSFPADPAALMGLPGMGPYTRNAVLSQAFDLRLPILEANSERLLSRLFARRQSPRQSAARRWLWQAAETLLPSRQIGEFNQALMELGALVCTPTAPACGECPLASRCLARQSGHPEEYPGRAPAKEVTAVEEVAVVLRRADKVLLAQRPADASRWASLWEFPHIELAATESHEQAAQRLLLGLGVQARLGVELATIRHQVTRFRIRLVCFEADHLSGVAHSEFYQQVSWLLPEELARYPVSSPQRRLVHRVAESGGQRHLF
jgi:A/G-specific adenine glycosylase